MTYLLAVSDWRSQPIEDLYTILETVDPTPDLLLYAGDDLSRFKTPDTDHLAALARRTTQQQVLYVRGNDDRPSSTGPQFDTEYTTDLHRTPYPHDDFVFIGQEGSTQGPGLISYTEAEVRQHLSDHRSACTDRTPILVTHTPPFGILDIGQRFGQRHTGSDAVRSFIDDVHPPLTVCGHCHQFGGRAESLEYGTVINIASHDGPNDPGRYALLTIDSADSAVEYELSDTRELIGSRLTDLFQVGRNRVDQFSDLGITSTDDITEDRREELEALPGTSSWHVDRWIAHRQALDDDAITILNDSAFDLLHETAPLLVDIETDLQQERIWLVGTYSYREEVYRQFFDPDDEAALLQEVAAYLDQHPSAPIIYYGGNRFDEQCLRRSFKEHDITAGVSHLERAHDLGLTVRQELFGPFDRYTLDVVASALGFEYRDSPLDGLVVGSKYTRYLLDGDEPDWERLKQYNHDDVAALRTIVDHVRS